MKYDDRIQMSRSEFLNLQKLDLSKEATGVHWVYEREDGTTGMAKIDFVPLEKRKMITEDFARKASTI